MEASAALAPGPAEHPAHQGGTAALTLAALGVVYGDIGTSPLYTMKEIFSPSTGVPADAENIVGAVSIVFWFLMLVVTLKYVMLIMRASNDGEGGIMALLALASLVWAFARLSRRFFGDARIGVFGGTLAVLVHAQLEFWHTAQPESFGGVLTAWAILLATPEADGADRRARAQQLGAFGLAGALYAFAGLLKPPLAGGALVSAAFHVASVRRRRAAYRVATPSDHPRCRPRAVAAPGTVNR